ADLLQETGRAHHKAFETTDGADPDWPIWYADYARDKFAAEIGMEFHKSQLIYCLMSADFEHQARFPDSDWPEFYADEIVQRYAFAESPVDDELALYYSSGCPFCNMVFRAIDLLDIDVDRRNIFEGTKHRDDLVKARGRATVPVLRITSPDGDDRWMPESRDIASYLAKTYA
ncbi:MAG: glutaredoxin family protein, partial [Woeseiaceae bacterium]